MTMNSLADKIQSFGDLPIAVLGDLIADVYISGTTSRISREAPVLIVREESREVRLGGAANVAANLSAMGGRPVPIGLVGADTEGERLLEILGQRGIPTNWILRTQEHFTTAKTRVLAGGQNTVRQQMLRVDRVHEGPPPLQLQKALVEVLREALDGVAALVISDYGEGVVEELVREEALNVARERGIMVLADSRRRIEQFTKLRALVPNEPELSAVTGIELKTLADVEQAGRILLARSGCDCLLVKRGRNGMGLFVPGQPTKMIPAFGSVEVADVTGAGDTVLSAFALALMAQADPVDAMLLANVAGGIKVTKSGTAVVTAQELLNALKELP
jgi:rfaE bifunctional protein kinase chain/domain